MIINKFFNKGMNTLLTIIRSYIGTIKQHINRELTPYQPSYELIVNKEPNGYSQFINKQ